jgi:UDP-glucose:(heptosyl)LPS alpha-1,3-glucosyltransferase
MVRIGLVIDCFDPRLGGAQGWTFQYAQRLLTRGHEVHVVTQEVGGGQRLPVVAHCLGRIHSQVGRAMAAEETLRSLDLDVIHDIGMGWYCNLLQSEDGSRLAMWEQRLKLLPPWLRPLKRRMIRVLPRYHDFRALMARQFGDPQRLILAVSKMCAGHYQQYHGVAAERIRIVYHGTDNQRFSPAHRESYREPIRAQLAIGADEVVFIFVGHDYRRKGLATAIRALARLGADGAQARLLVVGGNHRGQWFRFLQQHQAARVTFTGPVADPVPYYAAADAFVLPTFYDPCSLSVSEAAACGLPSVTSRFNGAAELLSEGVEGFVLADPADDSELCNRLGSLMDPALRLRMGAAARRLALRYTLERNCDELMAIYDELAPARRAAA